MRKLFIDNKEHLFLFYAYRNKFLNHSGFAQIKVSIFFKRLFILTLFINSLSGHANIVLIDPGHGGEDCGAKAQVWKEKKLSFFCEKDLALEIAKKIKLKLRKYRHIKTYLTRSIDRTLSLSHRAEIADKLKADIFISIHLNSSTSKLSQGIETYFLNNHDNQAVMKIEEVENRDIAGEERIVNQILADLIIERTAPSSKKLGELVHGEIIQKIGNKYNIIDRGLKPALFYVLALSKRPSVLLEAGFMSNGNDFQKVNSDAFQGQYARAVAHAIFLYFGPPKKKPNLF